MKNTALIKNIGAVACRVGLKFKHHLPSILLATGIVGTGVSTVMACNATTKLSTILEKTKEDVDTIHACVERDDLPEEYTVEDSKKDLAIVYVQTGIQIAKLYAPAIGVGILSIASILTSHNLMNKRNLALAAAYSAANKGLKEYHKRVSDRFGEDVARELKYGLKAQKIDEIVVDEETGKEKKVKKTVQVVENPEGIAGVSPYARFFDKYNSKYYEDDAQVNYMFLRCEQNYANDLLKSRGHLFLNDVYERLGMDKTPEGQHVGWIYDPNSEEKRDGYVDFGMYDTYRDRPDYMREKCRDFLEGHEPVILLDFNVDGDIWKLMKDRKYAHKFSAFA